MRNLKYTNVFHREYVGLACGVGHVGHSVHFNTPPEKKASKQASRTCLRKTDAASGTRVGSTTHRCANHHQMKDVAKANTVRFIRWEGRHGAGPGTNKRCSALTKSHRARRTWIQTWERTETRGNCQGREMALTALGSMTKDQKTCFQAQQGLTHHDTGNRIPENKKFPHLIRQQKL